jgi:putative transcriptional regulator
MSQNQTIWALGHEECKAPVRYTGCGLDDIWLVSGYEIEEIDGDATICVRNLDGLLAEIGRSLVRRKKLLTGKEIRFLRLQMDLSQSKLARLVGCDAQQVARYEKGQNKMPGSVDRLLRMLYREHLKDPIFVQEFLEALDKLDGRMDDKQVFTETAEGWKTAA